MIKKFMVVLISGLLSCGIDIGECLADEIDTAALEQRYPLIELN